MKTNINHFNTQDFVVSFDEHKAERYVKSHKN